MILVSDYNLNYHTTETDFWNIYHRELVIHFYLAPTCKDAVLLEIKKMKHMKAPDHDWIGTKTIHLCPVIFAEDLSDI